MTNFSSTEELSAQGLRRDSEYAEALERYDFQLRGVLPWQYFYIFSCVFWEVPKIRSWSICHHRRNLKSANPIHCFETGSLCNAKRNHFVYVTFEDKTFTELMCVPHFVTILLVMTARPWQTKSQPRGEWLFRNRRWY